MLVFIPPKNFKNCCVGGKTRRGQSEAESQNGLVFSLQRCDTGHFSIVCVRDHCVFVIVNVNKTQLTAL